MLTIQEVAQRLKVQPRTVYALVQRGQLRAVKVGRLLRVEETELEVYLDRHTVGRRPAQLHTEPAPEANRQGRQRRRDDLTFTYFPDAGTEPE